MLRRRKPTIACEWLSPSRPPPDNYSEVVSPTLVSQPARDSKYPGPAGRLKMTSMDEAVVAQQAGGTTQWNPAPTSPLGQARSGTSLGVNIAPGSQDDGWVVPPPVRLTDGTEIQLCKDGEALHTAFDVIRRARRRVALEVYIFHSDS